MTLIDSDPDSCDHRSASCDHRPSPTGIAWVLAAPWRVGLLVVVGVLLVDAGGTDNGPGLCVFRRCTGGYCPGCGMTRAARHLSRGQVGAAWQDHPWMVLAAVQAVVAAAVYAVVRRVRTTVDWGRVAIVLGAANAVLLTGIWIARLVDGSIPRFF